MKLFNKSYFCLKSSMPKQGEIYKNSRNIIILEIHITCAQKSPLNSGFNDCYPSHRFFREDLQNSYKYIYNQYVNDFSL